MEIFQKLTQLAQGSLPFALCTVVRTKGSVPRKPGARMIVLETGEIYGTIGGGALEMQVIQDALGVIKQGDQKYFEHALVHDHGMCCGGQVEILIEPMKHINRLYIYGAGHIGKALARFANQVDFDVTIIDNRPEQFKELDSTINKVMEHHRSTFEDVKTGENTFICVVTHDHQTDREIIEHFGTMDLAYLGMIGSERKVEMAKKIFQESGNLSEKQMEAIDWPMGIDIKVETPEEIAISILAKLIDVRANG